MSCAENQLLAQVLIRRQLLVHMHGGRSWEPRDYNLFSRRVFSLFDPRKPEQVLEMNIFIGDLCGTLYTRGKRYWGPDDKPNRKSSHQYYIDHYYLDLTAFRVRLCEVTGLDGTLTDRMSVERVVSSGVINGSLCTYQ